MSQYSAVNGVVTQVSTKVKHTSKGDKTIHYAVVDGQEFSTAFRQPFHEGEMVNVVTEFKFGENQLVPNQVPSTGMPPLGSAPNVTAAPAAKWSGGNKGTFPIETTSGQISIIRQSSMNRAVECLDSLMAHGIWKPSTEQEYQQKLLEYALFITDFGSGQDIMKMANANKALSAVV